MHPCFCIPAVPEDYAMPASTITPASSGRSDSSRSLSARIHNHANNQHQSGGWDPNRLSKRSVSGKEAAAAPAVDVKINDIVGNGISGILDKWVNYGRGWRPRWFILQDGVLSYFKVHGPDKIVVSQEAEKGSKIIGEDSSRLISRHKQSNYDLQLRRQPLGEVHLKVNR